MRRILNTEFRKSACVTDEKKIEELKGGAMRGLSNYLLYANGTKDPRMQSKIAEAAAKFDLRDSESRR